MIFINNKYTKWYYSIINRANARTTTEYVEVHHIIPRSLGGSNSDENLVRLTAKEHFVCHLLLTKMTTGNHRYKMNFAFHMISNAKNIGNGRYVPSSKMYGLAKKLFRESLKNYWTQEKRKEHAEKIRPTVVGRTLKESSREKLRNKIWTEKALATRTENCLRAAKSRKGSKWSDEHRSSNFQRYIEKNRTIFTDVFRLLDQGMNVRQVSIQLNISWDRVSYMSKNRILILEKIKN